MNNPSGELIEYVNEILATNPPNTADVAAFGDVEDKIKTKCNVIIWAFMENPEAQNNVSYYYDEELCKKLGLNQNSLKSITYPYNEKHTIISVLKDLENHYHLDLNRAIANVQKVDEEHRGRISITPFNSVVLVP